MIKAIIVVDVQNDFCEGGALAVDGGAEVATRITDFLADYDDNYDFILASRDAHAPVGDNGGHFSDNPDYVDTWPIHCVYRSWGAHFHPNLLLPKRTLIFDKGWGKPSYSAFEGVFLNDLGIHGLLSYVANGDQIEVDVVGIATDHCVRATALDAASFGWKVIVPLGLTAAVSASGYAAAVDEMRAAGVSLSEG